MTKREPCGRQRGTLVNSQMGTVAIGQGFGCRFLHKGSPLWFGCPIVTKGPPLVWLSFRHKGSPFGFGCCFCHNRSLLVFSRRFCHKSSPFWFGCPFVTKSPPSGLVVLSNQGGTLVNGQGGSLWTAKEDLCEQPKGDRCNRSRVLPWVWPSFPSQQVPPCVLLLFLSQRVPPWVWLSFRHKRSPFGFGCCFCHKVSPLCLAVISVTKGPFFGLAVLLSQRVPLWVWPSFQTKGRPF